MADVAKLYDLCNLYIKNDQTCIQIFKQFPNKFGPCLNKSSILCFIPLNIKCVLSILAQILIANDRLFWLAVKYTGE